MGLRKLWVLGNQSLSSFSLRGKQTSLHASSISWCLDVCVRRCGHCKRLAPTWDELADKFSGTGLVTIAKVSGRAGCGFSIKLVSCAEQVDCTEETSLCAEHGVRGYPT